jgi:hypothetical protein
LPIHWPRPFPLGRPVREAAGAAARDTFRSENKTPVNPETAENRHFREFLIILLPAIFAFWWHLIAK